HACARSRGRTVRGTRGGSVGWVAAEFFFGIRCPGPASLRAKTIEARGALAWDRPARGRLHSDVHRRGLTGADWFDGRDHHDRRPHLPEQGALRTGVAAGALAIAATETRAPRGH